ncbi:hypothetical protein LBMAG12_05800 [Actinomycetes bacterium]|nr:hypothetical protein LBMAG12_05800 [Actinomycetes bacterium]
MFVLFVSNASCKVALIPMIFVLMMQMTVMHIIQVIVMNDCCVSAIGSMDMRVFVLHGTIMSYTGLILRERIA